MNNWLFNIVMSSVSSLVSLILFFLSLQYEPYSWTRWFVAMGMGLTLIMAGYFITKAVYIRKGFIK